MTKPAKSDLAALQSAVASILMEPKALAAFQKNPAAFAKGSGLTGLHAKTLAELDVEGAAYFARRRIIDRFGYLRGDLPRSVEAVDEAVGLAATYFAERPYAFEEPLAEVKQFQDWAKRAKLPQAVKDLCAIECAGALLMGEGYATPKRGATMTRNSQMQILRVKTDPDALLSVGVKGAPKGRFTVAVVREAHDVEVYRLEPRAVALVEAADGKRTEAQVLGSLSPRFGATELKGSLRELRRLGILA